MHNDNHFDYIIVGNGLAGLQLALAFIQDPILSKKTLALIDPVTKTKNDKTWSFWEIGYSEWDPVVEKSWQTASFKSPKKDLVLPLKPYQYKSIRAIDFYDFAKTKLAGYNNIRFIKDAVITLEEDTKVRVIGKNNSYTASHVFDSRLPEKYFKNIHKYTLVQQHFKGWVIETDVPVFNNNMFTMMDYRFQYQGSTSFMYVLPFSETKALIEYTFFTPDTVPEAVYDTALEHYITEHLQIKNYQVVETEQGNIPMTDFPFWKENTAKITKIGTAGGWVKASTGYSFKHVEKNVAKMIANIKTGNLPHSNLFKRKYKIYDKIFLHVLYTNNKKGVWIFEQFYAKNTIPTMFRFLDEQSTFSEDLKIMKSLYSLDFIRGFFKVLFR
ncbi:lycopene cyclase family protein [Bizionia sediminis]|uniref:Lycopene cyclase family protein n=1 Tax=Bizionia sediminis TaxID=1737064 RepID=A0ABW5KWE6_9FLAO